MQSKPYSLLSKQRAGKLSRLFQRFATATDDDSNLSLYFQRAKLIDSIRLRLHSHDSSTPFPLPSSPLLDSFVASHTIRSATSPESAISIFRSFLSLPSFSPLPHQSLVHSLSHSLPNLCSIFPDLRLSPLHRLRLYAAAGDLPSALDTFSSIRSDPTSRRRTNRKHPCTESYNLVIGLYAAKGDHSSAMTTFSQMLADGAIPNSRTYTVIIDHLIRLNNVDAAVEVFHRLPSMRVRRTCKQYNTLANAFLSSGQYESLLKLIKEMNSDGLLPGRPMLAAIAKLRLAGYVVQTEEFVGELSPDQRIGYAVDCAEDEEEENEEDEEDGGDDKRAKLRPWIDPTALARALEGWDSSDVALLESAKIIWSTRLVCKLLRSFRTARTAWEFFCWVSYQSGGFSHDHYTVSRMISILALHGHIELVDRLLTKLQSENILLPFATVRLLIDYYGLSKNADAAIKTYRSTASICGPLSQFNLTILSSSLLRSVVKSGKGHEAMALLEEMMADGILLDIQTFSGLMEHFSGEGDLKCVHRLFGTAKQCGLKPDAFMYQVLIKGCCKEERAALAFKAFDEMLCLGLLPSEKTKGILVKSLWKEGKLREAAMVEERCEEIGKLPAVLQGHAWTVSAADFDRVQSIYSGSFAPLCESSL